VKLLTHEIPTPWGKIATIVDATNKPVVIGAGFKPLTKLIKQLPQKYLEFDFKKDSKLVGVSNIVQKWIDGDLDAFSELDVLQQGSEFNQKCWKVLRKIKSGKVITYTQLAKNAGNIKAVRAAGTACGKNLIAPFVPCHRVIKTGGAIGNYGFGISLKTALLTHEGVHNWH
jgi:methylated-DNA-[protein]-cysteine S-methyltransferase